MFYIPQSKTAAFSRLCARGCEPAHTEGAAAEPYQVVGTLLDQMTYPAPSGGSDLTEDRMREILGEVDLEYLLERDGALTEDIIWEDELSLSEKQRLAIARLIYNKPRYAILDEC